MEQSLNRDIDELSSTFEKMMRPHKSKYAYPRPLPTATSASTVIDRQQHPIALAHHMDLPSRMRAIKVFNVMLARLWRRRCAEVCDLHELVRKYQVKVSYARQIAFPLDGR